MKKVLYITSNPKEESKSFSLQVGRNFLNEYKRLNPNDQIKEIEVYDENIPLIDREMLKIWDKIANGVDFNNLSKEEQEKLNKFSEFTQQFIEADKYIFVTPMWNLGLPAMLKAYLDTIVVAGKTFKYTPEGPVGLLENKKAIHIHASGGVYTVRPASNFAHADSYLKSILSFIGVKDFESIIIEGLAATPDKADEIKENANKKALELAKKF
ncbi:FMN-dependent NADH-azoreductase [Clostridium sp.]|uniref:FMN-dependent NADH-azoreductase n=1 Tax=Clostridium sp. TaxID=1506 RepID=UPI00260FBBCD|nr:FMN-dependent NADH-azoreductase [Clostridium sp.]